MQNPQAAAVKKYMFDILQERYRRNERYIERMAAAALTKEDYDGIGSLAADLYEAGFMRAVDQYKDQLAKIGMKVNIVPEAKPQQGKPIFKN